MGVGNCLIAAQLRVVVPYFSARAAHLRRKTTIIVAIEQIDDHR